MRYRCVADMITLCVIIEHASASLFTCSPYITSNNCFEAHNPVLTRHIPYIPLKAGKIRHVVCQISFMSERKCFRTDAVSIEIRERNT